MYQKMIKYAPKQYYLFANKIYLTEVFKLVIYVYLCNCDIIFSHSCSEISLAEHKEYWVEKHTILT